MPRVRFLQAVAGEAFSWSAGDEVDMPGAEASKWADGERAELVRGEKPETPEGSRRAETTKRRARKQETATDNAADSSD